MKPELILPLAVTLALTALMPQTALAKGPVRVIASFSILADWAQIVGGSHVDVTMLIGPDSDAHAFRPTPSDARKVARADLLIINGLGYEGWLERLIAAAEYRGEIIIASEQSHLIARGDKQHTAQDTHPTGPQQHKEHGHEKEHDPGHEHDDQHSLNDTDPHAWHSLQNAIRYVHNIERALIAQDPQNAKDYRSNADAYTRKLAALQARFAAAFAAIPVAERKIVTAHDAFSYLGAAYEITLLSAHTGTLTVGSSAHRIAKLVNRIRRENIRAIFLENTTDPRLLTQIASETGVAIGGHLYSDALSAADGPASSYLKMMQYNLNTIITALLAGTANR